jgi:LIM domain kinase 1
MAPEMLSGVEYDERIDIFSFGIILCEIIGRVDPDPDYLPRTTEFGLSVAHYYVQFALKNGCPEYFFAIAVRCCEVVPERRPTFEELHNWHELLMRRKKLPKLPIPPTVLAVRDSVFTEYDLDRFKSEDFDESDFLDASGSTLNTTTEESS